MHVDWSKTASTAFAAGQLVEADSDNSGVGFDAADATSTKHIGIVQQTIASADSDYASATRLSLEVDLMGLYKAEVGTGTPTANYEGYPCDLNASGLVNVSASAVDVFLINRNLGLGVDGSTYFVLGFIIKWAYVNPN
jgi:hypothetical protein|tara:strand:+ start:11074 stop:11487 length:414 start_codon:yes stop_codon:yes gene_type:complete